VSHADEDLDVEEIYNNLSSNPDLQQQAMSVAEKLKAAGRLEGLEKGLEKGRIEGLMGQIQLLEEFLGLTMSPRETLEALDFGQLDHRCQELHKDYKARIKGQ
jgi:flagellar biosynthesis/type III secretory pathway protein FliH